MKDFMMSAGCVALILLCSEALRSGGGIWAGVGMVLSAVMLCFEAWFLIFDKDIREDMG